MLNAWNEHTQSFVLINDDDSYDIGLKMAMQNPERTFKIEILERDASLPVVVGPLPAEFKFEFRGEDYFAEPENAIRLLHHHKRYDCEEYKDHKFLRLLKCDMGCGNIVICCRGCHWKKLRHKLVPLEETGQVCVICHSVFAHEEPTCRCIK